MREVGAIVAAMALLSAVAVAGPALAAATPLSVSLTESATTVNTGGSLTLDATPVNPGGHTPSSVAFSWTASGGAIGGSGAQVAYTAPLTPGSYTITVCAATGHGVGHDRATTSVTVLVKAETAVLDQSNSAPSTVGLPLYNDTPDYTTAVAQTFTAGITGDLTKVTVSGSTTGTVGDLVVQIETVDAAGLPSGSVIGSGSTPSSTFAVPGSMGTITLDAPAPVVAGTQYAFVLTTPGTPASSPAPGPSQVLNQYGFDLSGAGSYAGGSAYSLVNSGPWEYVNGASGAAFIFQTWVAPQ